MLPSIETFPLRVIFQIEKNMNRCPASGHTKPLNHLSVCLSPSRAASPTLHASPLQFPSVPPHRHTVHVNSHPCSFPLLLCHFFHQFCSTASSMTGPPPFHCSKLNSEITFPQQALPNLCQQSQISFLSNPTVPQ